MKTLNKSKCSGISLLEVLITILIMAIGMLGIAALQIKSLSITKESYSRSQAVAVLADASARIRANRDFLAVDQASTVVVDESGNNVDLANPYTNNKSSGEFYEWCEITSTSYVPKSSCTGSCDSRDLALADMDAVCLNLQNSGLISAKVGAACNDRDSVDADTCSVGSKLTLYLAWDQEQRKDSGDKQVTGTKCQSRAGVPNGYSCVLMELVP